MTLKEFIRDIYPIRDRIEKKLSDPIALIEQENDLPYDTIRYVDGRLQKVVEIASDEYISVLELLSYYPKEVEKLEDAAFKEIYFAYMDNIDVTDLSIENIMTAAREYEQNKKKKEGLIQKCLQ